MLTWILGQRVGLTIDYNAHYGLNQGLNAHLPLHRDKLLSWCIAARWKGSSPNMAKTTPEKAPSGPPSHNHSPQLCLSAARLEYKTALLPSRDGALVSRRLPAVHQKANPRVAGGENSRRRQWHVPVTKVNMAGMPAWSCVWPASLGMDWLSWVRISLYFGAAVHFVWVKCN